MNRFIYRSAIWASNDYENRTIEIKRSIVRALFWRWRFCFVLCSHPFPSQCVLSPLPKSPNSLCLLDIIIVILVSLLLTSSLSYIRKILNIITVTMTFAIIEHWFHASVFSDILKNLTRSPGRLSRQQWPGFDSTCGPLLHVLHQHSSPLSCLNFLAVLSK